MKTTKRIAALLLAILMLVPAVPAAAVAYSGEVGTSAVIIGKDDTIADKTVFRGPVVIDKGAEVKTGTFRDTVTVNSASLVEIAFGTNPGTISGGDFSGAVTNDGTIKGGTFTGTVLNSSTISDGTFKGEVTNNGTISGGTFKGKVTNSASKTIIGGTFDSAVENAGTITFGTFNAGVNNTGKINGGNFNKVITGTGTVASTVSAIVYNGATYKVSNVPSISESVTCESDKPFECPKNTVLTIDKGGVLTVNGSAVINGTIIVKEGGKLVLNGAPANITDGAIKVYVGGTVSGFKKDDYKSITKVQYSITCPQNTEETTILAVLPAAFAGDKVSYIQGESIRCYNVTDITVTDSRRNVVHKSSDLSDSFTMPESNVTITVTFTENHENPLSQKHVEVTCTTDGYDRTYCSKCGKIFSESKTPATGHQLGNFVPDKTVPADEVVKGYRHCSKCNSDITCYFSNLKIEAYTAERTVDYKANVTFHAQYNTKNDPRIGTSLVWVVNGKEHTDDGTKSYTVKEPTDDYTIYVKIKDANVFVMDECSETETVKVKHGFFDIIIAFFKKLFNKAAFNIDQRA